VCEQDIDQEKLAHTQAQQQQQQKRRLHHAVVSAKSQ
jgi:hypothetical protein